MAQLSKSNLTAGVLKALGIFGGVQMINIICSLLRTKLIAIWIGAVGVGLFGIYNSVIDLLNIIFNLGIRDSAVRDIAAAKKSTLSQLIIIVRRWSLILGTIGLIAIIALSPLLSTFTFNDSNHIYAFIAIAFIIFLTSIQNGELAILQGTKQLNQLAKASMWGAIIGVLLSIPMFYFWGIDSVIPALIIFSLSTLGAVIFQRIKIPNPKPQISISETINKGRSFISLGIFLTISAIANNLVTYLFLTYLNNVADTSTVGHYQAGFTLVNKYMGILFTAIIMEYYPRLSQVSNSRLRTSVFVSHEMSIALWVLLPVIAIFIASSKLIITILYSSEFLTILPFIIWAVIGTVFRAISWCMSFTILARGDGKIFIITELLSALTCITLNILSYNYWGLDGLGFAYVIWYLIYTIIVWLVYRYRFHLSLGKNLSQLAILVIGSALICVLGYIYFGWYIPAIIAIIVLPYSIKHILNRRKA